MTNPQDSPAPSASSSWRQRSVRIKARLRGGVPFASGLVAALVAVALYGALVPPPRPLSQQDVNQSISSALASVTPGPAYSQRAYQAVAPSLVLVQTQDASSTAAPGGTPAPGSTAAPSGGIPAADGTLGSGVVVDASGDILTCLHVVADATSIQVTFADGTKSPATIQATQPEDDIAVLQATQPPANIVPAVLGNPRSVQIGSEAFVIGNPFGLYGSISAGIVSGLNRSYQLPNNGPELTGLIQVDAAVNPGDSGGPLVNRDGQVIGIVDALVNPTNEGVFIGIGLAVPIDVAGGAAGLPPD
jgi:S1-C subfamily serine protease